MAEFDGEEEIPWLNATLDNSLPFDYFKQDLVTILQAMKIPKWSKFKSNEPRKMAEIQVDRISGALTNSIYKISYKKYYPLLLRLYGAGSESLIDREKELKTLAKLSRRHIGPRLLGFFENGRIEQFLNNSITLTAKQIREPKISRIIARRMKELHRGVSLESEDKIRGPQAWDTVGKWMDLVAAHVAAQQHSREQQAELLSVPLADLQALVARYRAHLYARYNHGLNFFGELVFCHNDTQYGNLLFYNPDEDDMLDEFISKTESLSLENASSGQLATAGRPAGQPDSTKFDKKLVVIDFEYSGANVPAYDITNHFCEWMYDYNDPATSYVSDTARYPAREERLNFIRSYVRFQGVPEPTEAEEDAAQFQSVVHRLYNDCIHWRAANCLFWALWAVLKVVEREQQAHPPPTEYLEIGPSGEKYVIKESADHDAVALDEEKDNFATQNADDEFDYGRYALHKLAIFVHDVRQLGLFEEGEFDLAKVDASKALECDFIQL